MCVRASITQEVLLGNHSCQFFMDGFKRTGMKQHEKPSSTAKCSTTGRDEMQIWQSFAGRSRGEFYSLKQAA